MSSNAARLPAAFPTGVEATTWVSGGLFERAETWLGAGLLCGLLGAASQGFSTLHALLLVAFALWRAVTCRRAETAAFWGLAIAGCDVYWRMTGASIPWETGKLGASLVFLIYFVRSHARLRTTFPATYLLLLLPSSLLTLHALDWPEARGALSFNLSGPICLASAGVFFAKHRPSLKTSSRMLAGLAFGCLAVLGVVLYRRLVGGGVAYRNDISNLAASGGYGPNQVSAILGLGAVLFTWSALLERRLSKTVVASLMAALTLIGFALATLSRGGVLSAMLAVATAAVYLLFARHGNRGVLLPLLGLALVSILILGPMLEETTGGALSRRYEQGGFSTRDDIAFGELEIWRDHPLVGVGPGMAARETGMTAHTEVTRMLAEHGLLGLFAIIVLLRFSLWGFRSSPTGMERALVLMLVVWGFSISLHAAARIAAPAVVLALGAAGFGPAGRKVS